MPIQSRRKQAWRQQRRIKVKAKRPRKMKERKIKIQKQLTIIERLWKFLVPLKVSKAFLVS